MESKIAIIFDFDETLIGRDRSYDTGPSLVDKVKKAISRYQIMSEFLTWMDDCKRIATMRNEIVDYLDKIRVSEETKQIIMDIFENIWIEHDREMHKSCYLLEETKPTLNMLRLMGERLFLLSNTSTDQLDENLPKFGVNSYFVDVQSRTGLKKVKPDIEGLIKLIGRNRIKNFVLIDDSDLATNMTKEAEKIGYKGIYIFINRIGLTSEEIRKLNPDVVVDSLEEIPGILQNWKFRSYLT